MIVSDKHKFIYIDVPKMKDEETLELIKKLNKEFPTKDFQY